MKVTINGKKMVIEIEMQEGVLSSKGKSKIVVPTNGFTPTDVKAEGKTIRLNICGIIGL